MKFTRDALTALYDRLHARHGPQGWWPGESPFEVMAGAVLIQRTAWRNAEQALARLRDATLLEPARLADAADALLEECVRPAGFFRQKSARLRGLAVWVEAAGGIETLALQAPAVLRDALLAQAGIGPETADAILLYAFGRPTFVVDAYLRRVFSRVGLIAGPEPYEALRAGIERALGADAALYNEFHALLVRHGQEHCRSAPRCAGCVLAPRCARGRAGAAD